MNYIPFRFAARREAERKAASSNGGLGPSSFGSTGSTSELHHSELQGSGYWGSSDTANGSDPASESTATATAHPDLLASLWESKWFGCNCEEAPPDTSQANGSRHSTNSHSGTSTTARAAALSCPIMFSSKENGDLPPVAVTRLYNTPLPPTGLPRSDSLGMGTWTKRQTNFLEEAAEATTAERAPDRGTTPGSIVATWLREQAAQKTAESQVIQSEDAVEGAAWRWRFARRWHAEQTRDIDPATASTDKAEETHFLLGNAWNMQHPSNSNHLGRTTSSDLASSLLKTGSIVGVDLLLFDSDGGWAASHRGSSARQQQQQKEERERKAQKLWDNNPSSSVLPTVEIDSWGSFRFIVLRLSGLDAQDRIIVNGHNHCTDASLVENVNRKVLQLSEVHPSTLMVIGGGVMEWRRDKDHCLHLHSGYCTDTSQRAASKPAELLSMAAKLVRENLPSSYTVVSSDA